MKDGHQIRWFVSCFAWDQRSKEFDNHHKKAIVFVEEGKTEKRKGREEKKTKKQQQQQKKPKKKQKQKKHKWNYLAVFAPMLPFELLHFLLLLQGSGTVYCSVVLLAFCLLQSHILWKSIHFFFFFTAGMIIIRSASKIEMVHGWYDCIPLYKFIFSTFWCMLLSFLWNESGVSNVLLCPATSKWWKCRQSFVIFYLNLVCLTGTLPIIPKNLELGVSRREHFCELEKKTDITKKILLCSCSSVVRKGRKTSWRVRCPFLSSFERMFSIVQWKPRISSFFTLIGISWQFV